MEGWIVAWGSGNHLWHWQDWGRNLELTRMDVVLRSRVVSGLKKRLGHSWHVVKFVRGDVVSFLNNRWWFVVDSSFNLWLF